MKCPNCKLENPPDAMRCDCGYDFTAGFMPVVAETPPVAPAPQIRAIRHDESRVVITDINMRFDSMVVFMVKWAFASIPAFIIVVGITILVLALLGLFGSSGLLPHK